MIVIATVRKSGSPEVRKSVEPHAVRWIDRLLGWINPVAPVPVFAHVHRTSGLPDFRTS